MGKAYHKMIINRIKKNMMQEEHKSEFEVDKNTENINKEKITLFCLPFAGAALLLITSGRKRCREK